MAMKKIIAYHSGCLQGNIDDAVLSPEEWRQADRFKRPELRQQFIEIRSRVRQHLSHYVDCSPERLKILRTPAGKPYLADYPEVFFNLSHCQKNWVLVITTGSRIGVDIERVRERKGMEGLVKRCFSSREQQTWNHLPETERLEQFYRYWTAKEAFVKAVGQGIVLGLKNVQIAFDPQPKFVQFPLEYGDERHWRLLMPATVDDRVVMVCIEASEAENITLEIH